jgi:hypothetical protein
MNQRWTDADLLAHRRKFLSVEQPRRARQAPAVKPETFDPFVALCEAHGLPTPEREARFIEGRQFRADYLFRAARVIVEREGGIWSKDPRAQAAHARPLKIIRDMEKANLAQFAGFKYFRYTPAQLDSGACLPELKILMGTGV